MASSAGIPCSSSISLGYPYHKMPNSTGALKRERGNLSSVKSSVMTSTSGLSTYLRAAPRWVYGKCNGCRFTKGLRATCTRVSCHGSIAWTWAYSGSWGWMMASREVKKSICWDANSITFLQLCWSSTGVEKLARTCLGWKRHGFLNWATFLMPLNCLD